MQNNGRAQYCVYDSGLVDLSGTDGECAAVTPLPKINQVALVTTFARPEIIEVVDDIDSCDLVYGDHDRDVVDLIEEERCPVADGRHDDGMHFYRETENSCARCGMVAPWVRRDGCRQL